MNEQLILDRYRLVERLAFGGSAEVWRAHDEQLGRPVAVKRLHPHLLPDAASRRRLGAEARAAARLSHPVIVGIYDVDATGESPAIVMELVDGASLAARIDAEGPLPEREAVRITADVAEALYHAHQSGVVHRDVKPGNVLLAADGRTRLVDFGIAHSLAASAERLTMAGTVVGTLRSMAPEQLSGGPITPRTDLYGIGAVLHEALTGRPPYPAATPVALAEAQRAGPPSLEGIDPVVADLIAACLAHDPADRPLHAGALADALRAWLGGETSPARAALAVATTPVPVHTAAVTQVVPVAAVPATPPPAARPVGAPPRPSRSRRRAIAALAAGAGLVVVAFAAIAFGNARPGGVTDLGPSASPATTSAAVESTPTPQLTPGWLAAELERLAEACGPEFAQDQAAAVAGMERKDARELVRDLVDQCSEHEDD